MSESICALTLAKAMQENHAFFLLDVRNPDEYQMDNLGGVLIPLSELASRLSEIPEDKTIIVYCHSGYRSGIAQHLLKEAGFLDVKNLTGGIQGFRQQIA